MNDVTLLNPPEARAKTVTTLAEHIVEIISDSGEGAQRCGQSMGAIAARSGYGVWTVEIIPAEGSSPSPSRGTTMVSRRLDISARRRATASRRSCGWPA